MNNNTDSFILRKFVTSRRRGFLLKKIYSSIALCASISATVVLLLQLAFYIFPLTIFVVILNVTIGLFLLFSASIALYFSWLKKISLKKIALMLEKLAAQPHPWVQLALELTETDSDSCASQQLHSEVVRRASESLQNYPRTLPVPNIGKNSIACFAITLAIILLHLFVKPSVFSYWQLPFLKFHHPQALVLPGTISVKRNSSVTLSLVPNRHFYPSCMLSIRKPHEFNKATLILRAQPNGEFSYRADNLLSTLIYNFSIGPFSFPAETIHVIAPPRLQKFKVTLFPPQYTGREKKELADGLGNFSVYEGTKASFQISSVAPLRKAFYVSDAGDTIALKVNQNDASTEIIYTRPCTYTFRLTDTLGQTSDSLGRFYVEIIDDLPPSVRFLKPAINKILTPAQQETLTVEAFDDLGIQNITLYYRTKNRISELIGLKVPSQLQIFRQSIPWNLVRLSLYPADTVFYWATTTDNKPFGPKRIAVSDTFWFRVPTFEEIHRIVESRQDDISSSLQHVLENQTKLENIISELIKSAAGTDSLSWQQQQIVKEIQKNLKEQVDTLTRSIESLQETIEQLKQEGVFDDQIIQKMDAVRQAVEDIVKEYGDSILFGKFDNLGENISWKDVNEAIKNIQKMLPQLHTKLDETLMFLQMLRRDQKLAEYVFRTEKYAHHQQQLADLQENSPTLFERQKALTNSLDLFLDTLETATRDSLLIPADQLQQLDKLDSMAASMQSCLSRHTMPSLSQMNSMSAELMQFAQTLRQQMAFNRTMRMQRNRERMLDMANEALSMAQWQNHIRQNVSTNKTNTAEQLQALRQALSWSVTKLDSLELILPEDIYAIHRNYYNTINQIELALSSLQQQGQGQQQMIAAQAGLQRIAQSILKILSDMESAQMQGQAAEAMAELMAGLQKLSAKQGAINKITSDLLRQLLGQNQNSENAASEEIISQAKEQARQAQQQLAEQLQQLAEKYRNRTSTGMDERLKALQEEAFKLAKQLNNPDLDLTQRQEQFLSRMLQATLSLHKQDVGKEQRKSTSARTIFTSRPIKEPDALEKGPDAFYLIRARALNGNFPEEYLGKVKNYLDSLEALFINEPRAFK